MTTAIHVATHEKLEYLCRLGLCGVQTSFICWAKTWKQSKSAAAGERVNCGTSTPQSWLRRQESMEGPHTQNDKQTKSDEKGHTLWLQEMPNV